MSRAAEHKNEGKDEQLVKLYIMSSFYPDVEVFVKKIHLVKLRVHSTENFQGL